MFDKRAVYKESEFIALDDLVYAPLHALAQSNHQLRAQVVDAVRSMGTPMQSGQEESIRLNKLNIAYEQIRPDGDEGYSVDNLQMQVPLLSIVPLTNLNVEKAEIDFSTEVKAENDENGNCRMVARVCAPKQRKSDNLPRVSAPTMWLRSLIPRRLLWTGVPDLKSIKRRRRRSLFSRRRSRDCASSRKRWRI